MDNGGCPSLFPLHRCKTIHLVGIRFCYLKFLTAFRENLNMLHLWFEGHSRLSSLLDFAQNFEGFVVLLNHIFR